MGREREEGGEREGRIDRREGGVRDGMERGGRLPTHLIAKQSCRGTCVRGWQLRAADKPRAVAGQLRAERQLLGYAS